MATYSSKKYPSGSVTSATLADGTIVAVDLANDAVTSAKIQDAAITNAKLAADGFDAGKFTTGTLPIARVADGAVTAGKLASTLDLTGKTVTLPAGVGGKVLQVQQTQTNNQIRSTNTIPYDDSTPLFSEGVEVMALNFTPVSASSTLYIFITVYGNEDSNSGDNIVFPVFRESTCIGMGYLGATGGEAGNGANWDSCTFTVKHQPGSTTAQTYYVRAGCNAGTYEHLADTTYVGNAKYGANTRSTMVIFEVAG